MQVIEHISGQSRPPPRGASPRGAGPRDTDPRGASRNPSITPRYGPINPTCSITNTILVNRLINNNNNPTCVDSTRGVNPGRDGDCIINNHVYDSNTRKCYMPGPPPTCPSGTTLKTGGICAANPTCPTIGNITLRYNNETNDCR